MDIRKVSDDGDMKIVGGESVEDSVTASENDVADVYDRLRRNGELSNARRLGASLAGQIEIINSRVVGPDEENVLLHRKLLVIFSIIVAIESYLPERMLVRTALNVFYDILKKDSPELYDSMSVSGAITFYYLEFRKLGEMPADIGGAFAMLCGREEDMKLISLGTELFSKSFDYTRSVIDSMSFNG